LGGLAPEVVETRVPDAVDERAELHHVEVELESRFLPEPLLEPPSVDDLPELPHEDLLAVQKEVLRELHRERRSATLEASRGEVPCERTADGERGKPSMPKERRVLVGEHGGDEIRAHLFEARPHLRARSRLEVEGLSVRVE